MADEVYVDIQDLVNQLLDVFEDPEEDHGPPDTAQDIKHVMKHLIRIFQEAQKEVNEESKSNQKKKYLRKEPGEEAEMSLVGIDFSERRNPDLP